MRAITTSEVINQIVGGLQKGNGDARGIHLLTQSLLSLVRLAKTEERLAVMRMVEKAANGAIASASRREARSVLNTINKRSEVTSEAPGFSRPEDPTNGCVQK